MTDPLQDSLGRSSTSTTASSATTSVGQTSRRKWRSPSQYFRPVIQTPVMFADEEDHSVEVRSHGLMMTMMMMMKLIIS